ncbi:uncharacterized protein LOC141691538 [Apium graveolens]|uniref:uncharacterized protein LOC141691538 n=1 Tax=Apium graveolens TaxID=4045 RepID=UPI003D79E09B
MSETRVASNQDFVNMDVDGLDPNFWNLVSEKVDNFEEAFGVIQEPIIQLENFGEDDCHPEDQPWSQPLMYSEGEDDREWDEFLYYFSMKNRSDDEDNEKKLKIHGLRKCNLHHTCVGDPNGKNSSANHEFVDEYLFEKMKKSYSKIIPKPNEIADEFWVLILYHVAWKARNEKINGSYDENFKLVPSLCQMITRTNPKSIATYTYNTEDKTFESVTISFDAPMKAFINGCRNVVGLDGCHLKGKYGGCLLSALDGQNSLVSLGIMICNNDLFQAHMDSMMVENVNAFEYLMGEDPKSWCRAFFDHNSSCEHLSNNFSESFNNMITKIREKLVCTLVLMYGQLVMGLFFKRRTACVGWDSGDLVPSTKKLLKIMFKKTREYKVAGAVAGKWQLRGFLCQHAVCALQQIRPNWVNYCARYYSVDNCKITYASEMVPLEGPDDWEKPGAIIVPPLLRRLPYDETF